MAEPDCDHFGGVLNAARLGHEWAWREIYGDLAPSVLGYVRARGAVDPEALVGEVFLHVVRDIQRFDGPPTAFRSWVFVIAHHRLLDDFRRRSRRPQEVHDEVADERCTKVDVEDVVVSAASTDEVRAVISMLSPPQREVLLLRIVGGLSVEETALVLGKRRGAVKALQRRGVEAIRMRVSTDGAST